MVLTSAGKARGAVPAELRRAYLAGMSPLVPVAAGRLPGTCCCFEPAHGRVVGWWLEVRSLQFKEIGYGQQ
jgi:hypothetical protein